MSDGVPTYAPMLAAYHRAFKVELQEVIRSLPIERGQSVLDMATGDGFYAPMLAGRVGREGRVVAVDLDPNFLDIARSEASGGSLGENIQFLRAPIDALPFRDAEFDVCWCAQSLYSLPDPVESLKLMLRVIKPGGLLAVLESDTLHHVILPLPIELELSIQSAHLQALAEASGNPQKHYISRRLSSLFREAGLEDVTHRTFAYDRMTPLGEDERIYFSEYLKSLVEPASRFMQASTRRAVELLIDPKSPDFLLDQPDFSATCIDHLTWGRRQS